jgi:hypothetical protein
MDLVAFAAAVLGLYVASRGHLAAGSALVAVPLIALSVVFIRRHPRGLLFPYGGHGPYLVLPVAGLLTLAFGIWLPKATAIAFGFGFYYFGAAFLADDSVHYAGRGSVLAVKATRSERVMAYWLIICAMFTVSALLFTIALLTVSGRMRW